MDRLAVSGRSLVVGLLLAGLLASPAAAAVTKPTHRAHPDLPPGWLDATFSGDGLNTFGGTTLSDGRDVAIQSDQKILVAGSSGADTSSEDLTVWRYLAGGTLDTTFGSAGVAMVSIAGQDDGQAMAVQSDGAILVGGDTGLIRLLSNGTLDTTFGTGGIVSTGLPDIFALAVAADGSIFAAGSDPVSDTWTVAKLTSAGAPDTTFGTGGLATSFDAGSSAQGLALQADGNIVAAGWADEGGITDFALARYLPDGTPDTSFDTDGVVTTQAGAVESRIYDVALQSDGSIVVAGEASQTSGSSDITAARYLTDGSLDAGFGTSGIATVTLGGQDVGYALALPASGTVVIAGATLPSGGTDLASVVVRLTSSGSPDASFGVAGAATTDVSKTADDSWRAVALQADGKIVTAGEETPTSSSPGPHMSVGRYLAAEVVGSGVPGDFNGDGYADLAVGVPNETINGVQLTGAINVIWGGAAGLSSTNNQFIDEAFATGQPDALADGFGWSLSPGDFNGDGFSDLAVGAPYASVDGGSEEGVAFVLYGGPTGLSSVGGQVWASADPEASAHLGWSVASGDFNHDSYADLAIGEPGASVGTLAGAGDIQVIYGSPTGLIPDGSQVWNQNSPDVFGNSKAGDNFGWSVSAGDTNGDGFSDLAVGIPFKNVGSASDAGGVESMLGSDAGLTGPGSALWDQDTTGILDTSEKGDQMGYSVALGDVTGDGKADLVAGIPFEDVGTVTDAGAGSMIKGGTSGLTSTGNQFWNQNSTGIAGKAEFFDYFGWSVALGDFNSDGKRDAVFGVPGEDINATDQGAINVIPGASSGLTKTGQHFWSQDTANINDQGEAGDGFGTSLSTGEFGNGGQDDLAVGVPYEDIGNIVDAGAVNSIYGSPTGLTSTNDNFWYQNKAGILDTSEKDDWFGYGLGTPGPGGGVGGSGTPPRGRGRAWGPPRKVRGHPAMVLLGR